MSESSFHHALRIQKEICIGCAHCVKICPTEAIRVVEGKANLAENRCVDCGECYRVCPAGAINIEQDDFDKIFTYKRRIALIPSVFIGQFPENISVDSIIKVLLNIGFTDVFKIEHSIEILASEQNSYVQRESQANPLISAFCPAIVRLIQVKFPALVNNIILQKPPLEIAAVYFRKKLELQGIADSDIGVFYITPCAAKITAVKNSVGSENSGIDGVINMNFIYNKIYKAIVCNDIPDWDIRDRQTLSKEGLLWSLTDGEAKNIAGRCLAVDEIHNVIEFLEKVENEEIKDVDFLELRACDQSCAGGVLTTTNRFLAVERLKECAEIQESISIKAPHDIVKFHEAIVNEIEIGKIKPRSIMKLDNDMETAMLKIKKMNAVLSCLPKVDCGLCGAPNCRALAEDIAQQKAEIEDCIFILKTGEKNGTISQEDALARLSKIWGENKFDVNY